MFKPATMLSDFVSLGDAPPRVRLSVGLFTFMILSLALSLAGAQILGVLIILAALLPGNTRSAMTRRLWLVAGSFVAVLSLISGFDAGIKGLGLGIENTWHILIAPAACTLTSMLPERMTGHLKRLTIYVFVFTAMLFLVQWMIVDPAVYGRYGIHRSPYVFSMLLIPPSLLVLLDPGRRRFGYLLWTVMAASIVIMNSRGAFIAWIGASVAMIMLLRASFLKRRLLIPGLILIGLLFFLMPVDRWKLNDLARQTSIQHRLVIWSVLLPEIAERPLLGHGYDQFLADPAAVRPVFADYLKGQTNAHNGYLMTLHAAGLVGFVMLWCAYGAILRMLMVHRRISNDSGLVVVAAVTLMGIVMAAMADKTFYVTLVAIQCWFFTGMALGTPSSVMMAEGRPSAVESEKTVV